MIKKNNPIANRKDLIKLCSSKNKTITEEELDDVLRCLIEYMKIKIKTDSVPAFLFPYVGFLFTTLVGGSKQLKITDPPNNTQVRYERVQRMLMAKEYDVSKNLFNKEEIFSYYKRISKLSLEEFENLQNNEDS